MSKDLGVTNSDEARRAAPDIKFHGDPKAWECVAKASSLSQGWMKSTKRMMVPGGWIYQVTTEFRSPASETKVGGQSFTKPGSIITCAEALTFVPDNSTDLSLLRKTMAANAEKDQEILQLKLDVAMWKARAKKHGCDVEKGDPDCG